MTSVVRCAALISVLLTFVHAQPGARDKALAGYAKRRATLVKAEARSTLVLAKSCLKNGLVEEGRRWLRHTLRLDPKHTDAETLLAENHEERPVAAKDKKAYEKRKAALVKKMARSRLTLMRWCRKQGLETHARDLISETLELDPDHVAARDAAGFTRYLGKWVPKDEVTLLRSGRKQFGPFWVTANEHEALVDGKFPVGTEHRPIGEVDDARRSMDRPWKLRTRHFNITSNLRLQEVDTIARRLEQAYAAIPKHFGLEPARPPVMYDVTWTRTKSELEAIVGKMPGDYWYDRRRCGTFAHPHMTLKVRAPRLFYECVIDSEGGADVDKVMAPPGAWAFFGSAWLVKHLAKESSNDAFDLDGLREEIGTRAADYIAANGKSTLTQLNARSGSDWDGDFMQWAGASARFVDFLIHAQDGRHRAGLKRYLRVVARGGGTVELFEQTFGFTVESLQDAYAAYVAKR